jgi:hypothetical protein
VLGLSRNPALRRLAADAIAEPEHRFRRTGQPQRIFTSFSYAAGTWDRTLRVIVKAEHHAQGPDPRFPVVNVPGDPWELYEGALRGRLLPAGRDGEPDQGVATRPVGGPD